MKTSSNDVSIVVPIYNEEKHVAKAIESLINQTLENIQIILVNDGSKDNSQKICEEYAKKDNRIILINKENGGLAGARNTGMQLATGKYLMFLDSDDLFEPDSCENMYNLIEKTKADYVTGNYIMINEDGTRWDKPAFDTEKYKEFKLLKDDFNKSFFVMNSTSCNKIYNMQFLRDNDIKFKVPSPAEDDYFTSLCYIKANYGYYMPKIMYLYRDTPKSISKDCTLQYFKGINSSYKQIYKAFMESKEMNYYRYVYAKKNTYLLCKLIDSNKITDDEKLNCLKEFEWYFDLSSTLKICEPHESLRALIDIIHKRDYKNAMIHIKQIKEWRESVPENIKRRMTYPTAEDYEQMKKYDEEFKNK